MIIHSGLFSELRNASTTSSLLMILALFCPLEFLSSAFNSSGCDHADSQLVSFHVLTTSADIFLSISEAFLNLSLSSCFSYSKQYFPSGAIYTQKPDFSFLLSTISPPCFFILWKTSAVSAHFVQNIPIIIHTLFLSCQADIRNGNRRLPSFG